MAQMLQGAAAAAGTPTQTLELQLVREENEALKKVIEQMKIDMETIVEKVKSTFIEQNQQNQQQDHHDGQKVRELEGKIRQKEDQISRLTQERDRLIQISNDLRADLNRSQRLVNDLMNREMKPAGEERMTQMATPNEKRNYIITDDQVPMGMFDRKLAMSGENMTPTPAGKRNALETFGEGQMDMRAMQISN